MKTEKDVKIDKAAYREGTLQRILYTEIKNAFRNHKEVWIDCNRDKYWTKNNLDKEIARLCEAYDEYHSIGRNFYRGDLAPLKAAKQGPVIICGSGPSLDLNIARLKKWQGAIMCSESQAVTLRHYGVDPDYIVVFDGLNKWDEALEYVDEWNLSKTALMLNVAVELEFSQKWKGDIYYFRSWDPSVGFYDKVMRWGYDFITVENLPFACSLAAELSFACYLGYGPIFLMGADFAWRAGENYRFTNFEYHNGEWKKFIPRSESTGDDITIGQYTSSPMQMYYRRALMSVYWLEAPNLWTCSEGLLDNLLPRADGKDVIDRQGVGFTSPFKNAAELRGDAGVFLAAQHQHWFEFVNEDGEGAGFKLIDVGPDLDRLRAALTRMNERGEKINVDAAMAMVEEQREEAKRRGYIT